MDKQIYRSGNEVAEAVQYIGTPESFDEIYDFTNGKIYINGDDQVALHISDELIVVLSDGDYVVKNGDGFFYVFAEKWFNNEYSPAVQDSGSLYNYLTGLQDHYGTICSNDENDLLAQGKFDLIGNLLWKIRTGKFKELI